MITQAFDYHKPKTLKAALALVSRGKAAVLAGGTDLVVRLKENLEKPQAVVDIKSLPGLGGVSFKNGVLRIGALATFTDLIDSSVVRSKFPLLSEMAATVASVGIRNRATIAGNLCSAVPSLDSAPPLLAYEAVVGAAGEKGPRKIPLTEWFLGPRKTALKREIVTGITVPLPRKKHAGVYLKLRRTEGEDLAQAGLAVLALEGNEYRLAFCAVSPAPFRAKKTEAFLAGKQLSAGVLSRAAEIAEKEISPITDIRSSAAYRRRIVRVMVERGLPAARARLEGKNAPAYGSELL